VIKIVCRPVFIAGSGSTAIWDGASRPVRAGAGSAGVQPGDRRAAASRTARLALGEDGGTQLRFAGGSGSAKVGKKLFGTGRKVINHSICRVFARAASGTSRTGATPTATIVPAQSTGKCGRKQCG